MPRAAQRSNRVETPYTEIVPPVDLARYVDRLWLRTTPRSNSEHHYRVLPDGCVDVIVHADCGTAEIVGAMTHAIEVPDGPAEIVAVRFKPGTAAALTGCALSELTDRDAELAALGIADRLVDQVCSATATAPGSPPLAARLVNPACTAAAAPGAPRLVDPACAAAGAPGAPSLIARLVDPACTAAAAPSAPTLGARLPLSSLAHARLGALVSWLRHRLARAAPPDRRILHATTRLAAGARVEAVAAELAVSRQYLARAFARDVGVTPKQLARIARMQRATAALAHGVDLARIAADLGYADQSHLSRDLRALAGATPAAVARERPIVLAHLFPPP